MERPPGLVIQVAHLEKEDCRQGQQLVQDPSKGRGEEGRRTTERGPQTLVHQLRV